MEADDIPTVEVHYNGVFYPNPLVYFDCTISTIRETKLHEMSFSEFRACIESQTNCISTRRRNLYFCVPQVSLSEGLHSLQNDCDYAAFLEAVDEATNRRIDVYIDHYEEPLFDWIAEEEPDEDIQDEEEESFERFDDGGKCSHVEDEEVVCTKRTVNDHFLSLLCPVGLDEDSDEETTAGAPIYPRHDESMDWKKMTPLIGMKFANPTDLKNLLSNYAVANGYDLWYEKNDKDRLLVNCCKGIEPKCPFRLWASWMKDEKTFQIKTLVLDHKCSRAFKLGSIVTYKWIGKHFVNSILKTPRMSLRKMKARISKKFNINVSIGQCRNAKKYALGRIDGRLKDHYARLRDYVVECRRANPDSHVEIHVDPQPDGTVIFDKLYICFKGVVEGWIQGCRRVIGLDGCFLKGICKGELLAAVGRDANNHIYPIAWAVVNVENKSTWKWFIDNLMEDIGGGSGTGLTLLSDGHKGLLEAVKERVPNAEHRLCARHILANFHSKFKGEQFIKPFWQAVNATCQPLFEAAMKEIKDLDSRAYDYLIERNPKCWSKAFFQEGMNCDAVENGVSESFNSAIVDAREKPIITMLEDIRVYVMERLYTQKVKGLGWGDVTICPAIGLQLKVLKTLHRFWQAHVSGYQEFEVIQGTERYAVDIRKRECGCRVWQLTGIPCVHGMSAIASLNLNPQQYVADCYKKEAYLAAYAFSIHPLNDSSMWPTNTGYPPLPPKKRRLPGRPATKRKRGQAEKELSGKNIKHTVIRTGKQRCSTCKETGHNKSKCPLKAGTSGTSGTQDPTNGGATNQSTPAPSTPAVPVQQPPSGTTGAGRGGGSSGGAGRGGGSSGGASTIGAGRGDGASGSGVRAGGGGVRTRGGAVKKAPAKRVRKASERINKLGLGRKVVSKDGIGYSGDKPLTLD